MGLEYISQPQIFTAPVAGIYAEFTTISSLDINTLNLTAQNASIDALVNNTAQIARLNAVDGYFVNLTAENVRVINVTAENVRVINLTGDAIETVYFDAVNTQIENLTAENVRIINLTADVGEIDFLSINNTQINTLTSNDINVSQLTAENISSGNLFATKYFLIPETKILEALTSIELPLDSTDIELTSTNVVTITDFVSAVRGVTYTITNKGTFNVTISSSPTVFVRNGTTWRANTSSLSSAFLELPVRASCCVRGDTNFVSVW